jgi:glycosyltransferase involved in cell wall biosynthesis
MSRESSETMISIIVPVYNAEQYLKECVDSILTQSCRDLELLLIDDGSTDASAALCDAFAAADARVRTVHRENGGTSSARNEGLALARGEWIGFCDCDDYLLPGALECLLSLAAPDTQILVGTVLDEQEDGSVRKVDTGAVRRMSGEDAAWELLTNMGSRAGHRETVWFSVWNKLYRRELLLRFDAETDSAEDVPVNLAAFAAAGGVEAVCYVETPVYFWRWRGGSVSNLRAPKALLAATRTSRILLDYAARLPEAGGRRRAGAVAAFRHFYWYYAAATAETKKEMRGALEEMQDAPAARLLPLRWKLTVFLMWRCPNLFAFLFRIYKKQKTG